MFTITKYPKDIFKKSTRLKALFDPTFSKVLDLNVKSYTVIYKGEESNSFGDGYSMDAFIVTLNGEAFEYKTGLGHRTEPKSWGHVLVHAPIIDDVLYGLLIDWSVSSDTLSDFCDNTGYDTDSRSALKTYLKCQENGFKLRKALGLNLEEAYEKFQDY